MEKTTDEAWREIVVEAMSNSIVFEPITVEADMIAKLVRDGFSLADIRDHWDDLQRRITK